MVTNGTGADCTSKAMKAWYTVYTCELRLRIVLRVTIMIKQSTIKAFAVGLEITKITETEGRMSGVIVVDTAGSQCWDGRY